MIEFYRPSRRVLGAMVVLLAWVLSLGWLGLRQLNRSDAATMSSEATLRLAPGSAWYAVYAGSTQVGNAGITLDTLSPGYRISEATALETPDGNGLARASRRSEIWLGATLNLERIRSHYSRAGWHSDWSVDVFGDTVSSHFVSEARRTQGSARFATPPTAAPVLPYRLAFGDGLASRRSRSVMLLDSWPPSGRAVPVVVGRDSVFRFADSSIAGATPGQRVVARVDSTRAFSVTVDGAGGPRRLWVDRRGTISGVETVFGVRWVRTDFDLSETEFRTTLPGRTAQILAALPRVMQLSARADPPDTVTAPRRFLVQHRDGSPVDTALLALLAGGRQSVQGDTLTVGDPRPHGRAETMADTTADPMVQANAGAIMTLLGRLAPESLDSARLPAFLRQFRALMRIDTAASAAEDALGTLAVHAGRVDGIARLFTALLRADRIPARYVIGVSIRGDTMLTHAWVEIWNPHTGNWYAVDPASGQFAASSNLIRLAYTGSSHPDEMLALLANARLSALDPRENR